MWNVEKNENIPTKSEKNRTKPGNPYYLVLFENRTKPGTVLSETVLSGDSLYLPAALPNSQNNAVAAGRSNLKRSVLFCELDKPERF